MKQFYQIKKKKLYEEIADQIENQIYNKVLKDGDKLPSETALAQQFGVSRNILREALKVLSERGLISVQTGVGVFVTLDQSSAFQGMLSRYVQMNEVSLDHIFEIRLLLEGKSCANAALNITKKQLEHLRNVLRKMHESMDNRERWTQLELDFHSSIAEASGNPLFLVIINSLSTCLNNVYSSGFDITGAKAEGLEGHEKVLAVLEKHDSHLAEKEMILHITKSRDFFKEQPHK